MSFPTVENSGADGKFSSFNGTCEDNYLDGNDAIISMLVIGRKSEHISSSFHVSKFALIIDILTSE